IATVNDGTDTYTGGAGTDTYDLSLTTAGATVTATVATSAEIGTDTLATIENIIGSQGNDVITVGAGGNVIDGQGGDAIIEGVAGGDVVNVNAIDANTAAAGNQNFTFIGTATFTAPGQLRYFQDTVNTLTILEGNVTGNAGAEFQIALAGLHNPLAGDFTL